MALPEHQVCSASVEAVPAAAAREADRQASSAEDYRDASNDARAGEAVS